MRGFCLFAALFFLAFSSGVVAKGYSYPSSCKDEITISYPFRFNDYRPEIGHPQYELDCQGRHTILRLSDNTYYVKEISYENRAVRIVEPGLADGNCSYLPQYPPPESFYYNDSSSLVWITPWRALAFLNCSEEVNDVDFVDAAPCISHSNSPSSPKWHFYILRTTNAFSIENLQASCALTAMVPTEVFEISSRSIIDIYKELRTGFWIAWEVPSCSDGVPRFTACSFGWQSHLRYLRIIIASILLGRIFCGIIFVIAALIYKLQRRYLGLDTKTEEFLSNYMSVTPTRYSYSEIKKMTKGFKQKLGQGGFGFVFKGMLTNRRAVAVKILEGSKGNGQDFINEVATLGRIHHFNVVRLIGFCCTRRKRALVYDFMPNGSLDKYIFAQEGRDDPLSWEKIFEIALGVARGIEYLHQGCAMKILHFDIKPHNILLDKDFIPKVSDFGLAKFCQTDSSFVSLTAARGTVGYMAPELFYRNVGGVSYKSDVYSFGMLLLEMAGRRKNVDAFAQHSSQIYFPSWIYDQISCGREVEMGTATYEEKQVAKKLIIVALWCIQMRPVDRPSMSRVVKMLEESADLLQIPPRPFSSSPHQVSIEVYETIDGTTELEEPLNS